MQPHLQSTGRTMLKSVETQVVAAVIAAAALVAAAAGGLVWTARAAKDENVADAIASSIGHGGNAQPLLDSFTAAGTIRSAVLYDQAGKVIARSGAANPACGCSKVWLRPSRSPLSHGCSPSPSG